MIQGWVAKKEGSLKTPALNLEGVGELFPFPVPSPLHQYLPVSRE